MYQNPYGNPYDPRAQYPGAPYPPHPGMPPSPVSQSGDRLRPQPRFFFTVLILGLICAIAYLLLTDGSGVRRRGVAIVEKRSSGGQFQGQAVIVRDESLMDADSITSIDFIAEEGSLVSRNTALCSVYSAGYNQIEIDRLNKVRLDIQAYHRDKLLNSYVDPQLSVLQDGIGILASEIRAVVHREGRGNLNNLEKQLNSALKAKQEYMRKIYPDDNTLLSYYENERGQLRKIESWTTTYTAHTDCLVSFYTDGYEGTVNAQTFGGFSPSQVHDVLAGRRLETDIAARGRQPIYRTVTPDIWYVLMLCNDKEWNPSDGQAYKMQLEGFQEYLVDATVLSSTRIGNEILVRMEVQSDVRPVLNLRTTRMVVGEFVDGLSVPLEALFSQGGEQGVVIADGERFVPVTVISSDGRDAFVRTVYAGSLMEGQGVLTF